MELLRGPQAMFMNAVAFHAPVFWAKQHGGWLLLHIRQASRDSSMPAELIEIGSAWLLSNDLHEM